MTRIYCKRKDHTNEMKGHNYTLIGAINYLQQRSKYSAYKLEQGLALYRTDTIVESSINKQS